MKEIKLTPTMKYILLLLKEGPLRPKDIKAKLEFSSNSNQVCSLLLLLKLADKIECSVNQANKRERFYKLKNNEA